jgi:hypothetical protein
MEMVPVRDDTLKLGWTVNGKLGLSPGPDDPDPPNVIHSGFEVCKDQEQLGLLPVPT